MAYATIEQADEVLGENWAIDDITKQNMLNVATIKIDSIMTGFGDDLVEGQENVFPLKNQTKVPLQINLACVYEAGALAKGEQDLVFQSAGMKSESTKTASVTYDNSQNTKYERYSIFYSKFAIDFLYSWIPKSSMIGREVKHGWSC